MKALVGAFNQEKALVGAFSVIVQLNRLIDLRHYRGDDGGSLAAPPRSPAHTGHSEDGGDGGHSAGQQGASGHFRGHYRGGRVTTGDTTGVVG